MHIRLAITYLILIHIRVTVFPLGEEKFLFSLGIHERLLPLLVKCYITMGSGRRPIFLPIFMLFRLNAQLTISSCVGALQPELSLEMQDRKYKSDSCANILELIGQLFNQPEA